ncbi:YlbE-like family protein [Bacillus kexueae]|uniref:YlbE-like family protein n=1 Tax=Aeribacillus kexueae TaxID=2078952 RepID=UPI001FB03DCE
MRQELYNYIQSNQDLRRFIREQPHWYRKLTRDPKQIENMQIEMMNYYQKTIPHRVSGFSQSLQLVEMMIGMMGSAIQKD